MAASEQDEQDEDPFGHQLAGPDEHEGDWDNDQAQGRGRAGRVSGSQAAENAAAGSFLDEPRCEVNKLAQVQASQPTSRSKLQAITFGSLIVRG